jgi:hypothetical protein
MINNQMKIFSPKISLPATAEGKEQSKEILLSREDHSIKNENFSENNQVLPHSG